MTGPPMIIAHRGASGYLPEHTAEAKALAAGQGADYLEQDVVATRNDRLVVLHDIHLDRVTDVACRFPSRHRRDGRFYARDFDLAELKTLNVHERRRADGSAVYPGRFPTGLGHFRISTLDEELDLVRGLNASLGRTLGLYPEVKQAAWHREEGVDMSSMLLGILADHGYRERSDPVFVQCFEGDELRRIRSDLGSDLKLIQLLGDSNASDHGKAPMTPEHFARLAGIVDGIGPWTGQLYTLAESDGQPVSNGVVSAAHAAGLVVHPYTFRADELAPGFRSLEAMIEWFVSTLGIDGFFTDFPDRARQAIDRLRPEAAVLSQV